MSLSKYLDEIFAQDGILSKFFPSYEPRVPQIQMSNAVRRCLEEKKHGLIEAGTATGKSLGYGFVAALYALLEGKRVIISTFTVNLQNQLIDKDLPLIRDVLQQLLPDKELSFELAKGRSHYICKRRLEEMYKASHASDHPHWGDVDGVYKYIDRLWKGDRSEIPFSIPDELWSDIQGDVNDCLGEDSPYYGACFIQQARRRLRESDIIVTNHAMFFTDFHLKEQGLYGIFPDYDVVIFDEGHRIEDIFSNFFQMTASVRTLEKLFDRCLNRRAQWAKEIIKDEDINKLEMLKQRAMKQANHVFEQIVNHMINNGVKQGLLRGPLIQKNPFHRYFEELKVFILEAKKRSEIDSELDQAIQRGIDNMIMSIEQTRIHFDHLLFNRHTEQWANWITIYKVDDSDLPEQEKQARRAVLTGSPIQANTVLKNTLFKDKTVVLTSATLSTQGTFDFVAKRVGMDSYLSLQVDSPFEYERHALLIIPNDAPSPKDQDAFQEYTVSAIKKILIETKGRTFLLFTNFNHLERTAENLRSWMDEQGLIPIIHSRTRSREEMLTQFKDHDRAVLFGAESFWEGVDVPGDDLICVVIVKLPFPVPDDPLTEARCEKLKQEGRNPFFDYFLPMCILKLKQGFGRLIRTVHDKGAVVILDSRVIQSMFGDHILRSLPKTLFSTRLYDIKKIHRLLGNEVITSKELTPRLKVKKIAKRLEDYEAEWATLPVHQLSYDKNDISNDFRNAVKIDVEEKLRSGWTRQDYINEISRLRIDSYQLYRILKMGDAADPKIKENLQRQRANYVYYCKIQNVAKSILKVH